MKFTLESPEAITAHLEVDADGLNLYLGQDNLVCWISNDGELILAADGAARAIRGLQTVEVEGSHYIKTRRELEGDN